MADDEKQTTMNPNDNMEDPEDTFRDAGGFFDPIAPDTPHMDRGGTSNLKVGFDVKTVLQTDSQDIDDEASDTDDEYGIQNRTTENPKNSYEEQSKQDAQDEEAIVQLATASIMKARKKRNDRMRFLKAVMEHICIELLGLEGYDPPTCDFTGYLFKEGFHDFRILMQMTHDDFTSDGCNISIGTWRTLELLQKWYRQHNAAEMSIQKQASLC